MKLQKKYNLSKEQVRRCRKVLLAGLLILSLTGAVGCGKKKKLIYGDIPGTASGKIDLSGKEPVIEIDNIKVEKGKDVDYTSALEVIDNGGAYSVDVNASNVKYDTPGTYNVGYTVKTDQGTYTSNVKVTVSGDREEAAGDQTDGQDISLNGGEQTNQEQNADTQNAAVVQNPEDPRGADTVNNAERNDHGQNAGENQGGAGDNAAAGSQENDGQNAGAMQQTTARRELITGSNNTVYKTKNIENAVIELLSGDVVTVSCTTSKYITQTRTDVSMVKRNGHTYEVSKLIIVFNTGLERTLETVEKKID